MKAKIKISCRLDQLGPLRKKCRTLFKKWAISEKNTYALIQAIDEACANAIIHGHACNEKKQIDLLVDYSNGTFTACINDIGKINEDLSLHLNKPIDHIKKEKKKGGLGLKIIHEVMDDVYYKCKDGKYSCLMIKNV